MRAAVQQIAALARAALVPRDVPHPVERLALFLLVSLPIAFNAIALAPELTSRTPNVNDGAEHHLFALRANEALDRGEDPLDPWVRELESGYPQFLTYQNLPHLAVVALHRVVLGTLDIEGAFNAIRYVLLVTFPLTVFWSLRRMELPLSTSAFAAAAATLISGSHRYGFEYDSYVWRGFGLYTQLVGMHLSFISVALLRDVIVRGRSVGAAALILGALALSHLIYAYMMALTGVVLFLGHTRRATLIPTVLRGAAAAILALAISSYMWVPFFSASAYLNVSPFFGREFFDSFGAPVILRWLVTGDLLDHGRWPVLTLLLFLGIAGALGSRTRTGALVVALFGIWLVLYFGRPTLGPLVDAMPLGRELLLHRFIGGVELFAVVLVGIGGGMIWSLIAKRPRRALIAVFALLLVLAPAFQERWGYYAANTTWMQQTAAAVAADADATLALRSVARSGTGRAYAGQRTGWGAAMDFGIPFRSVKMYNLFVAERIDALAPPYRSASLNSDLFFLFDERRPAHARVFAVDRVIAPVSVALPEHFAPLANHGRYVVYEAPGGGFVDFAAVVDRELVPTRESLHQRMQAWFVGPRPDAWQFVRYDLGPTSSSPWEPTSACPSGSVDAERVADGRIAATVECSAPASVVLKTTFHPNWVVTVDGRRVSTFMLSPSFLGVTVPAGRHVIEANYVSSPAKQPLAFLGLLTALGIALSLWRPQGHGPTILRPIRRLLGRGL